MSNIRAFRTFSTASHYQNIENLNIKLRAEFASLGTIYPSGIPIFCLSILYLHPVQNFFGGSLVPLVYWKICWFCDYGRQYEQNVRLEFILLNLAVTSWFSFSVGFFKILHNGFIHWLCFRTLRSFFL